MCPNPEIFNVNLSCPAPQYSSRLILTILGMVHVLTIRAPKISTYMDETFTHAATVKCQVHCHPPHPRAANKPTIVQEPAKPRPIAAPIDILDNDTAKLYTHLHPILVLSLYAFKWRAIVADPVPALWNTLIWLGMLQVAYAALCLPPTTSGGSSSAAIAVDKKKPGEKKKAGPGKLEAGLNQKIIVSFCTQFLK